MIAACSISAFAWLCPNAFFWLIRVYTKLDLKLQKFILWNYSWENATLAPNYLQWKSGLKDAGKQ